MMPPHLSILITPSEIGDSEKRVGGWGAVGVGERQAEEGDRGGA